MSRYTLKSRSATSSVHGHDGIAAVDFRLEVDGVAVGNNPVLLIGQAWYDRGGKAVELLGRRGLVHGAWAAPRGMLLLHPSHADWLIDTVGDELGEFMHSIDDDRWEGWGGDTWPGGRERRLEFDGPTPPWE